jgi:hypothetical protein
MDVAYVLVDGVLPRADAVTTRPRVKLRPGDKNRWTRSSERTDEMDVWMVIFPQANCLWENFGKFWQFWADSPALTVADSMPQLGLKS